MGRQPNDQSNSAAWTLWHLNRVCDNFIHMRFQDKAPLWVTDGWHEKFGMAGDAADFGMGWDSAKVAAWQAPAKDVLFGYASRRQGRNQGLPRIPHRRRPRQASPLPRATQHSLHRRRPRRPPQRQPLPRRPNRLPARLLRRHGLVPLRGVSTLMGLGRLPLRAMAA